VLAKAGVIRLRGVVVGTAAHQSYPATLGVMLSNALLQTSDLDIGQFSGVSLAVGRSTSPMLDVLRGVGTTFREAQSAGRHRRTTGYIGEGGLSVDFATR